MKRNTNYKFPTSAAAWAFMNACDDGKVLAGFPSIDGAHTVQVLDPAPWVPGLAERLGGSQVE